MHRHFARIPATLNLSIEEEAIAADEAIEQTNQVEAAAQDVERLGDIVVSMGDVETVVSNTPEIGTIEQALVAAASDMAVAGTDADPEQVEGEFLPATTDEEGKELSAEAFADNVKSVLAKMWEGIKQALTSMWNQIQGFFAKIMEFLAGTSRRVERLEQLMKSAGKDLARVEITSATLFKGSTAALLIRDEPSKNLGKDFAESVAFSQNVIDVVADQGELVINGGVKMLEAYLHDAKKVNNNVRVFTNEIENPFKKMAEACKLDRSGFNHNGLRSASAHYVLGGLAFGGWLPKDETMGDDNVLSAVRAITSWVDLKVMPDNPKTSVPVPLTNREQDIKAILDTAKKYVKSSQAAGALIAKVSDHTKQSRAKIDSLVKDSTGLNRDGFTQDTKQVVERLLQLNSKVNSMVGTVLQRTTVYTNRMVNNVLDYAIQSCQLAAKESHHVDMHHPEAPASGKGVPALA